MDHLKDLDQEYKRIQNKLFGQEILNRKQLKKKMILDPTLKPLPGLDRIKLFVGKNSIKSLSGCRHDVNRINISGNNFLKLKSGIYQGNWWCHLDVNLPKVLDGNNLKNVRRKADLLKIVKIIELELSTQHHIEVNLLETYFYSIELNILLILEKEFSKYNRALDIITFFLLRGVFKRKGAKFNEFRKFSGISYGSKNKYLTLYDKSLEQLYRKFGTKKWYQNMSKSEIVKIAKKYMTLARLEFFLKGDPLMRFIPKSQTFKEFIETSEDSIDLIYSELVSESGLDNKSFEKKKEAHCKKLAILFKRYIKKWPKLFTIKFINENQNQVFGVEQIKEAIKNIGGSRNEINCRFKSAENEFRWAKNLDGTPLECWRELHEFIEIINEKM